MIDNGRSGQLKEEVLASQRRPSMPRIATIESMGMVVSEGSGCEYCLQSHTLLGTRFAKLDAAELELNRR
jgi:AhpD family alkylhydroperoxidase